MYVKQLVRASLSNNSLLLFLLSVQHVDACLNAYCSRIGSIPCWMLTVFLVHYLPMAVLVLNMLFKVFYTAPQGKYHLCSLFLGIAPPQSQFPHSCVCEQFIYTQDRSTYFPAAEQADLSWKYINLSQSQIQECRNWETEHYNLFWNYQFHFWEFINGNHIYCILDSHRPFICSVALFLYSF